MIPLSSSSTRDSKQVTFNILGSNKDVADTHQASKAQGGLKLARRQQAYTIYLTHHYKHRKDVLYFLNQHKEIVDNIKLWATNLVTNKDSEKLTGQKGLYSLRTNGKGRLLFRVDKEEQRVVLLYHDPRHDYNKSINATQSSKMKLNASGRELVLLDFEDEDKDEEVAAALLSSSSENYRLFGVQDELREINKKYMVFDDSSQNKVLDSNLPLVVVGNAGSGKTTVVLASLFNQIEQKIANNNWDRGYLCYVTKEQGLANAVKEQVFNHFENHPHLKDIKKHVIFASYDQLVDKVSKPVDGTMDKPAISQLAEQVDKPFHRTFVGEKYFKDWWLAHPNASQLKHSTALLYNELKLIHTCTFFHEPDDTLSQTYQKVGVLYSPLKAEEKELMLGVYLKYLQYLADNNVFDSALYDPGLFDSCHQGQCIVMSDETQDLSAYQVHWLIWLTCKSHIGKRQFCMLINGNQSLTTMNPYFAGVLKAHGLEKADSISLDKNYRNPPLINDLATKILTLKTNYLDGCVEKYSPAPPISELSSDANGGVFALSEVSNQLRTKAENNELVILVLDESQKERARREFGDKALVFTVNEFKGMDYPRVVAYNFFARPDLLQKIKDNDLVSYKKLVNLCSSSKLVYKSHGFKNKDITTEQMEFAVYLNCLYAGITRSTKDIIFVSNQKDSNILQDYFFRGVNVATKLVGISPANVKDSLEAMLGLLTGNLELSKEQLNQHCLAILKTYIENKATEGIKELVINGLIRVVHKIAGLTNSSKYEQQLLDQALNLLCQISLENQHIDEVIELYKKLGGLKQLKHSAYSPFFKVVSAQLYAHYSNHRSTMLSSQLEMIELANDEFLLIQKQKNIYAGVVSDGKIYHGTVIKPTDTKPVSGYGKFVMVFNSSFFVGSWEGGSYIKGRLKYSNRDIFNGTFNGHLPKTGIGSMRTNRGFVHQGNFLNGLLNGLGRVFYPGGSEFYGVFKDGEPINGEAIMKFANGTCYIGSYRNGQMEGDGKFIHANGKHFKGISKDNKPFIGHGFVVITGTGEYEGDVKDGKMEGQGTLTNLNGKTFEGVFRANKPFTGHGFVAITGVGEYEGDFKNGKMEGQGTLTYFNGSRYEDVYSKDPKVRTKEVIGDKRDVYNGFFKNNLRHGHGTLTFASGDAYTGNFSANEISGTGTLTYSSGGDFTGEFKEGLPYDGFGTLKVAGSTYVGRIIGGNREGEGMILYPSGNVYKGNFEHGIRHGQGQLDFAKDGSSYIGTFTDGKQSGAGTYRYNNGKEFIGTFNNGQPQTGKGYVVISPGFEYEGQLVDGKRHGAGTYKYDNGKEFIGTFKDDQPQTGNGYVVISPGIEYEGPLVDGKRHGVGTVTIQKKIVITGRFENDQLDPTSVKPNEKA